jgi:hypothetical protein
MLRRFHAFKGNLGEGMPKYRGLRPIRKPKCKVFGQIRKCLLSTSIRRSSGDPPEHRLAKILGVVIRKEPRIPRSCRFGEFSARHPSRRLHVLVFAHFPHKPLDRRKVLPQGSRDEARALDLIPEVALRRGKKYPFAVTIAKSCKLPLDLVRRQKVIRVQPLDVIPLTELKRMVAGRRCTFVLSPSRQIAAPSPRSDPWTHRPRR